MEETSKKEDVKMEEGERKTYREASEVFIFMHRIFRASRNLRAHWYIDHLDKPISIQEVPQTSTRPPSDQEPTEYEQEMTVVGIVPQGGDGTEIVGNEEFLVTVRTKCTYISRYYRIVYVLDLSPSVVVADDESNCCLVDRLVPSFRNSIRSSVKSFVIPGTNRRFQPQVFTSVCLFSPFLKFEEKMTLVQGVLVTEVNVDIVIKSVETQFHDIFKRLFTFSRPILEQWGKLRRRHKHNKFDSLCESDSTSEDNTKKTFTTVTETKVSESPAPNIDEKYMQEEEEEGNIMSIQRGIWAATEKHEDQRHLPFASDKSYVTPDWSLIFMLRTGLLQIQMLPENTQSNLVIISDSVCGMPDEDALQKVLTQLRGYTVAFSFIQLQKKACCEPVFGHVGSSSLFHFMTLATFGTYLPRQMPPPPPPPVYLWRNEKGEIQMKRSVERDEMLDESTENINQFHRALICWSFQNALNDNDYLLETFAQINRDFLELQQSHVDRHRRFVATYQATLNRMMYVRLREGFTLKSTLFVEKNTKVILTLRLAFRPLVFIDYIITTSWPVNKNEHQLVYVELVLEAPYNELKDLLTESNYMNPIRLNLMKSVIDGIIDADRLLLHIHSFDTKSSYFTIPPGVTKEYALFQQGDNARKIFPQLCIVRPDGDRTTGFVTFWRKMLEVDDTNWQKWVHTQTERGILNLMHLPFEMFSTDRILKFDTRYPLNAVLYSVKVRASFCLVENQTYVTLAYETETSPKPLYFFIRKIICIGPVVIIKTAFLGGVTSIERRRAVEAQRQRLINVTYGSTLVEDDLLKEARRYSYEPNASKSYMDPKKIYDKRYEPACTVIRRPLERLVVRYNHAPADLTTIVRAEEKTNDEDEIILLTLHNTLAKNLYCRRSIILLNVFEVGGAFIVRLLADFCQNVLMHKRLNKESYRPAWTINHAVSLVRQVYDSSGASLEQFIMFPAMTVQPDIMNKPILKRKMKIEEDDDEEIQRNWMPSKTAFETLAIVCEMWNEPEGGRADDQLANMSAERRLNEDLRFISIIITLDKIIRLSGTCDEVNKMDDTQGMKEGECIDYMFPYGDRCRCTNLFELTGTPKGTSDLSPDEVMREKLSRKRISRRRAILLEKPVDVNQPKKPELPPLVRYTPKPPTPGIFPVRFLEKDPLAEQDPLDELDEHFPFLEEEDLRKMMPPLPTITDIHADPVSKFVTAYSNLFSLTNLVFHAQRKYVPMPHFILGEDSAHMQMCNDFQLNALHCQLSEITDLTWIVHETEMDIVFADLVKTIPEADRPPRTDLRVYVKALAVRLIALFFVPMEKTFDPQSKSIPIFLMTVHEAQIAHCYAHDAFDKHMIVSDPMASVPERWDSRARFGWTPNNRNVFPEEITTFASFTRHFEEEILPRIRMRAMYEAALKKIPLNEDSLVDMSGEVDFLEFELPAIPVALRKVCKHLKEDEESTPPKENICCRGSNIEHMFHKMLGKNFDKVIGTETMFYLSPEKMLEMTTKKTKRTKPKTRGNSGMMYVDSAESLNSLEDEEEEQKVEGEEEEDEDEEDEYNEDEDLTNSEISEVYSDSEDESIALTDHLRDDPNDEGLVLKPKPDGDASDDSPKPVENENGARTFSSTKLDGEEYREYNINTQPMFIQFNCSVNYNGTVNSFPINFLPTCVHQLLDLVEDPPTEPEDIQNVEIVLELLVLTTQRLKPTVAVAHIKNRLLRMAKSRIRNPYEFERQRRESYRREDEMSDDDEEEKEQEDEMKSKKDVLFDLPSKERKVMYNLIKNVGVILDLEKILLDSRTDYINKDLLENVKRYIDQACTTTGKVGHAETRWKPFLLVDNSRSKIAKFMNLMENRTCGYLKLERLGITNMFYCRSVLDEEIYESMKLETQYYPEESEGSDKCSDFWIVLTVDKITKNISLHFCQRFADQHTGMVDQLWAGIRQELRVINQESLLERMYILQRCERLMVAECKKVSQFEETDTLDSKSPPVSQSSEESTPPSPPKPGSPRPKPQKAAEKEKNHAGDLPADLYYYFVEGYFACQLQTEIWITIPQRLLETSQKLLRNQSPLKTAFENMKAPLVKYSVTNRQNVFVYKDFDRNQIFYFQMHMDRDSYALALGGTRPKLPKKQRQIIDNRLKSKVCVTFFGISPLNPSVVKVIWDALIERIDVLLLQEIMRGYAQNREQSLIASEVAFLQPVEQEPNIRSFFSIPSIFHEFLPSFLFYIGQHIEAISSISPAKVKENGVFYNGAAFMRTPIVGHWEPRKVKKRVQPVVVLEEGVDQGVEAKEGNLRGFSLEEKEEEPVPPPPPTSFKCFRSHKPYAGELPPDYSLSSFFIYHVIPARGVTNTGIALIEFRIVKTDGKVVTRFDQPSMNEMSHKLLVPNVLDDKATVYRDIIKSQAYSTPDCEKSLCGYVEMIAWTKGEVDKEAVEKIMHDLIEMSMIDVITEFGYLNTTIVEEGALLPVTVGVSNRNSEVFIPPPESHDGHQQIKKQGSASSVTTSVDTRHHTGTSHSGEIRRSLVYGGSIDTTLHPASISKVARMPSIARDIEHSLAANDMSLRRQDFMNRKNAYSIIKWLDYVASKQGDTNSVTMQRIRFEFQHASLPALFEIRNRLEVSLGGLHESDIRERVYLCALRKPTEVDPYVCANSLRESSVSIYGMSAHEPRFEVLTTDPFHAMTDDCGVDESQNQEEYVLISCIKNVFDGYGENMIRTKTQVDDMKQMFRNHLHGKYSPLVQTHMYSPRQRLMMAYLKGDFMTIYFYNYHSVIHKEAVDCANKIVGFHNAKSRLLREIGLHKMGITHLSPFHTEPLNEYDYEVLIWTDPTALISKEFPGDHKPPPAYVREPQCSNIFFRMYRQPDLQVTMGRSKTLFKSECVKTMHYEQMLRWRSGLKTKLDFIQKVTKAHVEMMKKVPTIFEQDLLLFIRPPKVAKKLGPPPTNTSSASSIRHRHLEDDHTEDNTSMTERTSKRASMYGESVRSQLIAESEIFKGKGEFLKKTELKLDLAACKFHEIRTPFFLRSTWNKSAPRRAGEFFDEVVRETDIRLILEDSLKEFQDIYEVQKVKLYKQLIKRKYSEKSEVPINIVPVHHKRVEGEEEETEEEAEESEWSNDDSDLEDEPREALHEEYAGSSRSNSESKNGLVPADERVAGDENFQRTYGKVHRSWKPNPPTSPTPFESRRNSFSANVPMSRPSSESGPIEKMFSFFSRRLSRKAPEKEASFEKEDPLPPSRKFSLSYETLDTAGEYSVEPPQSPIMYKHAEEFARYFTRKYGFIQFNVEHLNRRSKALNRYTTNSTLYLDLPYLVFYKPYDGGVIFADLKYEMPEFVVSFHMYERAKMSSADYYMIDQMEALYKKESQELHTAANQLKESVCFTTFNFDYHIRAVATFLDAKINHKPCVFGTSMNVFQVVERLLDYYQYDLILSKNLVAMKYVHMTKEQSDWLSEGTKVDCNRSRITMDADAETARRYSGTPFEEAICHIQDANLYNTNLPVTTIELTGILGESLPGKLSSRVVPSIKLRVHMDDIGDGELWHTQDDRAFVEEFEGLQRRRLIAHMAKYGTDIIPTPWEDSCVRRIVREVLQENAN